jgi:sialic acid synthase SpsE
MRNVHLITKEQEGADVLHQYLYITSEEEIKKGDWFSHKQINYLRVSNSNAIPMDAKKIILTTDPDLIKDGVQAINDKFLEWFIANPSYEEVEVEKLKCTGQCWKFIESDYKKTCLSGCELKEYKIIIPQEEPKQETLEEAAEKLYLSHENNELLYGHSEDLQLAYKAGILDGAKWQSERMYSEAIEFAEWIRIKDFQTASKNNWIGLDMKYYTTQELFEQFKKK